MSILCLRAFKLVNETGLLGHRRFIVWYLLLRQLTLLLELYFVVFHFVLYFSYTVLQLDPLLSHLSLPVVLNGVHSWSLCLALHLHLPGLYIDLAAFLLSSEDFSLHGIYNILLWFGYLINHRILLLDSQGQLLYLILLCTYLLRRLSHLFRQFLFQMLCFELINIQVFFSWWVVMINRIVRGAFDGIGLHVHAGNAKLFWPAILRSHEVLGVL